MPASAPLEAGHPAAGSRPARPSTRGRAGRRGSAGRSCPRTARGGPRGRSASRRRAGRPARARRRPCRRPRRRPAGVASMSAQRRPFASSTPSRWLRDSGEPQVAITSPMPASPAKVSGFAPAAIPSRVISARPRVISPALPLSPKPSAVRRPGGDRDDVLERAAQLDADEVAVDVEPEPRAAPSRAWTRSRERLSVGRHHRRRRQAAGDLEREVRAGQRRDPAGIERAGLGDDLAHPQQRPGLEALDDATATSRRRRIERRDPRRPSRAGGRDGTAKTTSSARRRAPPDRPSR